jgi:hypothetical protein
MCDIQKELSLPTIKDKRFYITCGKFYLSFGNCWTENSEWAMQFSVFDALHKMVDLNIENIKMKEIKHGNHT